MSAETRHDRRLLRSLPAEERYLFYLPEFVEDDECWIWEGPMSGTGYGQITVNRVKVGAHRFVYEQMIGPIPDGMQLDHVRARGCTSRACVNPSHLEPVTQNENIQRSRPQLQREKCKRGHRFTPENSYVYRNGRRECRTCKAVNRRRHFERTGQ